jgi:hypothetical protein
LIETLIARDKRINIQHEIAHVSGMRGDKFLLTETASCETWTKELWSARHRGFGLQSPPPLAGAFCMAVLAL